jgi:hypothetical protein
MDKTSKTFSGAGFYLVLIFSFFVSVYPAVAYIAAFLAFGLWILEQLIFRNADWIQEEMFSPVAGFIVFTLIASIVARIYSSTSILPYTGYLALFYFVVQRFVSFSEKRKMIVWTFIAGVILSSAVNTIKKISGAEFDSAIINSASQEISFFLLMVFGTILAFYSESDSPGEKLFFGFLSLPLVAIAVLTLNIHTILIMLVLFIVVGIAKDRTALIPLCIYLVIFFSGIFDIKTGFSLPEIINILNSPVRDLLANFRAIENLSFYGIFNGQGGAVLDPETRSSFIKLLAASGPPALLLLLWILVKQFRIDFVKFRKTALREMKAFHLGIVLAIASFIALNLFGSIFDSNPAILVFWMIMGMSEI